MLIGIGTDILKFERLAPILANENYLEDSFIRRTFTPAEIALAESRDVPLYCYATRFAGKEAVFKALTLTGEDCRLDEIEILSDNTGKPCVILHGRAETLAKKREISRVLISLSYENDCAIAFAAVTAKAAEPPDSSGSPAPSWPAPPAQGC